MENATIVRLQNIIYQIKNVFNAMIHVKLVKDLQKQIAKLA